MARLLIPAVCLALLLIACSGDGTEPDTTVDPATLLQRAAAAVQDAGTFHFKLTHENGTTPLPLNLQLVSAEGDFQVPDKLAGGRSSAKAPGGINVSVKVIAIERPDLDHQPVHARLATRARSHPARPRRPRHAGHALLPKVARSDA